jgi:hypothetical protein
MATAADRAPSQISAERDQLFSYSLLSFFPLLLVNCISATDIPASWYGQDMKLCTRVTFDEYGKLSGIVDDHEPCCDTEGVHIIGEKVEEVMDGPGDHQESAGRCADPAPGN